MWESFSFIIKISTPYKRGLSLSEELVVEVSLAHSGLGFMSLLLQAEVRSGQAPTGLTPTPSFSISPFSICATSPGPALLTAHHRAQKENQLFKCDLSRTSSEPPCGLTPQTKV